MNKSHIPRLSYYLDAGLFIFLDLYCAQRIVKSLPDVKEEHIAFIALLLALSRQGHLAFPLDKLQEIFDLLPKQKGCDISLLEQMLYTAAQTLPPELIDQVIIKDKDTYYLQKNWLCEREIIEHLNRVMQNAPPSFPYSLPEGLNSEQQRAITSAFTHPLSLLTGGPGTGKTYTAVEMIRTFLSADPDKRLRVAISAPTGKAVAQLDAYLKRCAIEDSRIRFGTLHALLGLKTEKEFQTPSLPLFTDLLIVDESSMIDARLFARLLASILKNTRVVFIGDPNQLPPVELGSIFKDLITAVQKGFPLALTHLTQCVRSEKPQIIAFAQAVRLGDSNRIRELLSWDASLQWIDIELKEQAKENLYSLLWENYGAKLKFFLSQEKEAIDLLYTQDQFRLLSCMRQGAFGVDAINHFFAQQLLAQAQAAAESTWWAIPLLISRSDYTLELYNGDTGLLLCRAHPELTLSEVRAENYALFIDRKGSVRTLPAAALPAYELGYCLSVHKSQGSEYDQVAIVIPPGSECFGREVLYTAATRTRHNLTCLGSLDILEKILSTRAEKISGISAALTNSPYEKKG